jgi:hypothetical protein
MAKTNQIFWMDSPASRKFLKRRAVRVARQLGKRLLEDAPKRVTRGYWT